MRFKSFTYVLLPLSIVALLLQLSIIPFAIIPIMLIAASIFAVLYQGLRQYYGGQEDRTEKSLNEHEDEAQQNIVNYGSLLEAAQQQTLKITPDMLSSLKIIGIYNEGGEISPDEIKKAYKKAALKNHPDKGGNNDRFIAVKKAYDKIF